MKALFNVSGLANNQGAKEEVGLQPEMQAGTGTGCGNDVTRSGGGEFMCRGEMAAEEDDDGNDTDSSSSGSIESRERPYPMINYRSLYVFHQLTPPRNFAIRLYSSSWFERISMAVILVNCVTLGMFRPCEDRDHCTSRRCHVLEFLDLCISIFFMVEMAIKVLALGCFGEYGYFKDTWNKLDAFIVFSSILEYTINLESVSISAVRTVRVLRPLRAINRVPSLRILVMLLLDTLPMLGNVLMLCFFVFFIFGIIAVQLWAGNLRNRCYLNSTALGHITIADNFSLPEYYETGKYPGYGLFICSQNKGGTFHCDDLPKWNYGSRYCEASFESANVSDLSKKVMDDYCINLSRYYTTCKTGGPNPFQGAITFDNILLAWVAIFQIISLEGWADIMYIVQDSHSFYDFFYFVLLIVIGAFFMLNLCLVVIATQFSETKRRESRLITEQRMQKSRTSNSTMSSSFQGPEIGAGCYDEIVALVGHTFRKAVRHAERFLSTIVGRHKTSVIPASRSKSLCLSLDGGAPCDKCSPSSPHYSNNCSSHYHKDLFIAKSSSPPHTVPPSTSYSLNNIQANVNLASPELPTHQLTKNALPRGSGSYPQQDSGTEIAQTSSFSSKSSTYQDLRLAAAKIPLASQDNLTDFESSLVATPVLRSRNTSPGTRKSAFGANSGNTNDSKMSLQSSINGFNSSLRRKVPKSFSYNSDFLSDPVEEDDLYKQIREAPETSANEPTSREEEAQQEWKFSDVSIPAHKSSSFEACYHKVREFVDSDYFMYGIFICILLNTMSMAVEFHQQPELLTNIVETSNLIFSLIFALEMFIKISVHGVFGYLKNGYNLFDGFIVIISLIELFGGQKDENGGGGGTGSGLSVLRTFRLLRVLKLVRFMPALRRQLLVMLKTMDNVATFFGLLMLFMFIFSILGMHLFGCKFCKYDEVTQETVCDRKNFDSLLWAVITVFQDDKKSRASSVVGAKQIGLSSEKVDEFPDEFQKDGYACNVDVGNLMHNEGGIFLEVGGGSTSRLRAPPVTPVSVRTTEDASSLASRSALVPPTIIQTAATPPSMYRSIASDVDFHMDNCYNLNLPDEDDFDESKLGEDRRFLESRNSKITNRSFLSVPEERRGSSPRVAVMCRPYSADYENAYTCNETTSGLRFKRGSITEASQNLCRVLYDYRLENSAYQVTYKLPPAVERRLSFAMQQHIKSLSIPRNSMGSNSSFNSVPQNAIINCSGDPEKRRSSSVSTQQQLTPSAGSQGHEHQPKESALQRKLSSISYTKYQEAFGQPLFITPPELVAHLERAQRESRKSLTYKLSQLNPCFFDREEYSLYLFSPENEFRKRLIRLIGHSCFDYFILMFILANCAAMALERPTLPTHGPLRKSLDIADLVFTIVFTIEMALKVMAKGLFIGKDSYVKSGWNAMDGILVCISLVDLVFSAVTSKENKIFGVLRVFRLLRTLRPLRVISRAPGLKLVVQTLLSSLRPIGNIVLICCTFFIIFGILGVQLFKGTFYHCTGPDIQLVTNKTECLTKHPDNQWLNKKYNFDNLPQALMSLFVLSSKDGWINIMYSGLDAVGVDKQPIKNYNEWRILYFISFLLLVGFFVLNMFVGVVVENFHKVRAAQQAEEAAYKARILAHKIAKKKRKAMRAPYHTNYSPMRLFIHNLVMSAYFDLAIAVVIIINVITMSIEHYDMPVEMIHALKIFNYFFTAVFIMESTMKIYALGFLRFIKKRWNKLDLVIVLLSVVGIALEEADTKFLPINPTIIRVMRVFRIARVFKLLKMAKGVRQLLDTVMQALPQVGNLGLLFFLMFFIFAALGVELFGRIECNESRSCEGLSRHASFQNFGIAYLTLFRIATGDNWNGIMKDTLSTDCDASEHCTKNCCVSMVIAPIYFVVFVLMAQFVLVNVVVAVLMKHLEESHKQNEENVDKELLMEYMMKLEQKEKRKEEKKRLQKEKKERKKLEKKGLNVSMQEIEKQEVVTSNIGAAFNDSSGANKRVMPQPLSISNRQNDGRPVSIVKPMIEGRPVSSSISSGTCSPGIVSCKSDKINSASIVSVHDAGVMTSLHGTPTEGRRESNSAAQLSRMSSLPISGSRPRDPDRDSDSVATASPRGSNYSVNVNMLTRAGSEDKSTQTFESRMNEGRGEGAVEQEGDDVTATTPLRGRKGNNRPPLVNSPCSVVLHKISLPSLEEAGDDFNSEEDLETPKIPRSNGSQRKGQGQQCSPNGVTEGAVSRPKALKLSHQTTQQRRTLMGLRRQQRVEEFPDEGDSSSCAENGPPEDSQNNRNSNNSRTRQDATDSLHASPNLSRSMTVTCESNTNLQRNTLLPAADNQPLRTQTGVSNNTRSIHSRPVSRSHTLSTRRPPIRMDSLEVPSFHPGGQLGGQRQRHARSPASNLPDNTEGSGFAQEGSSTSKYLRNRATGRRKEFAKSAPSASLDQSYMPFRAAAAVSPKQTGRGQLSVQTSMHNIDSTGSSSFMDKGVNTNETRATLSPAISISYPDSAASANRHQPLTQLSPPWAKQASDESQHSVSVGPRQKKENGEEVTPDEHLSSPEMPRRKMSPHEQSQPSSASNVTLVQQQSRSKFKVNPKTDVPKLRRVPTMWAADTHMEPPLLSDTRKLFASDPHLKQSPQTTHKTITQNLSHGMDCSSNQNAPSGDDVIPCVGETTSSPNTFTVETKENMFMSENSSGSSNLQSNSIKFHESAADVDPNFSEA